MAGPGLALFDVIAAAEKTLHANPGRHVEVPRFEIDSTERFFARHLTPELRCRCVRGLRPQAARWERASFMESGTGLAGRYRLEWLLGRGRTGETWRCRDLLLDRDVAVKVLLAALPDPDDEKQLRRDAESAAALRHPGIAAVFDVGQRDGRMFIVTELLHGQDLASLLRGHPGGLPVGQALRIGAEIAAALAGAHGKGIVHGDLRPLNVFIQDDGVVKVRDFGLARTLNATPSAASAEQFPRAGQPAGPGQFPGPPAYSSPELWAGEPVTGSADLYALGCMLYELLAGRLPFQGPSLPALIHQHLTEVPVPPRDRRPEVPAALSDLVAVLLAKAPESRPPDAAAAAAALTQIRDSGALLQIRDSGARAHARAVAVPSGPLLACASPAPGAIDIHAVSAGGRIRCCAVAAGESGLLWRGWRDLPPRATGNVSALAAGSNGRGVYLTAVIDGIPRMNEGQAEWRELLGTCPLRLPVADVAVPSAPRGAAAADGVTCFVLDGGGVIWSSRAPAPLATPAAGQFAAGRFNAGRFNVIASCTWGKTDPVLLAAAADDIQCRFWWAGAREFRWRPLPLDAAGPPVTDIACASLAAKRIEAFVLCDDGSIWQSSLRLAQEGTLDWSTWCRLPPPPGRVTAIAACQFDQRDGAIIAATSDGEIYFAAFGIEVIRTGLSRWSQWSRVPAA